jgi:CheY-like chemotaxis protein
VRPPDVLLVDDSELVTVALGLLLSETGHAVRTAATVAAAVAAAREATPDVLLLDLTLPDGDGLDVLRALSAEGRAPRATVALTGHDDPETAARCREAGCVAVLVKPVRAAELLRGIREWTAG